MVDKKYCMSSYMAFRYIEDSNKEFYEGMKHNSIKPLADSERILVHTIDDIDREIGKQMGSLSIKRKEFYFLVVWIPQSLHPISEIPMRTRSVFLVVSSRRKNWKELSTMQSITA